MKQEIFYKCVHLEVDAHWEHVDAYIVCDIVQGKCANTQAFLHYHYATPTEFSWRANCYLTQIGVERTYENMRRMGYVPLLHPNKGERFRRWHTTDPYRTLKQVNHA